MRRTELAARSDEQLLSLYTRGELEAMEVLLERYKRPVFSFVLRLIGDRARAEDLLQETFLRLVEHAHTFEGSAKLTLQDTVVGSLTYIAPERLRADPADHRADVYAMAIILFELLAGRPPFSAPEDADLIAMHVHASPPSLRDLEPTLPFALDDIIQRALSKQAKDRYADAAEMANAIELAARELAE